MEPSPNPAANPNPRRCSLGTLSLVTATSNCFFPKAEILLQTGTIHEGRWLNFGYPSLFLSKRSNINIKHQESYRLEIYPQIISWPTSNRRKLAKYRRERRTIMNRNQRNLRMEGCRLGCRSWEYTLIFSILGKFFCKFKCF